jgi:hypothetical protein
VEAHDYDPGRLAYDPQMLGLDVIGVGQRFSDQIMRKNAPVAELVDAPDSKSGGGNIVLVRVRPGAPGFAPSAAGDFARKSLITSDVRRRPAAQALAADRLFDAKTGRFGA